MVAIVRRPTELLVKLALISALLSTLLALMLAAWRGLEDTTVREAVQQPIAFSHKHHVGDVGLDCRFCHAQVERSSSAGLPSTQICLNCHSELFAAQKIFEPLRESARSGRPIAWNRVHRLPDFVYFDHSIHVAKGVACIECHGRVDQMPLMERVASLRMDWCVECHRNPMPRLRDPGRVFDMTPIDTNDTATVHLLQRLQSQQRLTDCSTCHR
jgi:hypothetical protein